MLKLEEIRHRQGMSLRQLSLEAGIALSTLQRVETSVFDPRLSTLRELSKALNVSIAELIGETVASFSRTTTGAKEASMAQKYSVKGKDKAVSIAVNALEKWRRQYVVKGLGPFTWNYEYDQVDQGTKLLKFLLTNLKGPDSRTSE